MARILKMTIELFPPSEHRPEMCFEVYEQIRTAGPNRILHFGMKNNPTEADLEWVLEVVGAALQSAMGRTLGITEQLPF
jgi:hypothetical protein